MLTVHESFCPFLNTLESPSNETCMQTVRDGELMGKLHAKHDQRSETFTKPLSRHVRSTFKNKIRLKTKVNCFYIINYDLMQKIRLSKNLMLAYFV